MIGVCSPRTDRNRSTRMPGLHGTIVSAVHKERHDVGSLGSKFVEKEGRSPLRHAAWWSSPSLASVKHNSTKCGSQGKETSRFAVTEQGTTGVAPLVCGSLLWPVCLVSLFLTLPVRHPFALQLTQRGKVANVCNVPSGGQ